MLYIQRLWKNVCRGLQRYRLSVYTWMVGVGVSYAPVPEFLPPQADRYVRTAMTETIRLFVVWLEEEPTRTDKARTALALGLLSVALLGSWAMAGPTFFLYLKYADRITNFIYTVLSISRALETTPRHRREDRDYERKD